MVVLVCAMHVGLERRCVCEEFGVEDYEEFGIQLRMRVKIGLRVLLVVLTSRGSLFQETPGQDWMTSLQALSIYSLFTTSLNMGSAFPYAGKVRTIL